MLPLLKESFHSLTHTSTLVWPLSSVSQCCAPGFQDDRLTPCLFHLLAFPDIRDRDDAPDANHWGLLRRLRAQVAPPPLLVDKCPSVQWVVRIFLLFFKNLEAFIISMVVLWGFAFRCTAAFINQVRS